MGYFSQVPIDLDEAAMLDGCNRFNLLGRVLLPLVMPGFLATAVICFIYSWNEFFFAYVLTGRNAPTIPVGIAAFITQHGVHWDQVTATGTLIMLPILVFGVIIQRYFVRGLIEGALAGQ
jgi:multiple sugar transport system permease protein